MKISTRLYRGALAVTLALTVRATVSADAAVVHVGRVNAAAGTAVPVPISLKNGGAQIEGVQVDISFDGSIISISRKADGSPDCTVTSELEKLGSTFVFLPTTCSGPVCTTVRALVMPRLPLRPAERQPPLPIPDDAILFSCVVAVAADTSPGIYPLRATKQMGTEREGRGVILSAVDGYVAVTDPENPDIAIGLKTYVHPNERFTLQYGDPWRLTYTSPGELQFLTCDHLHHGGTLPDGCAKLFVFLRSPDTNEYEMVLRDLQGNRDLKISPVEKLPLRTTETFSQGKDETYNRSTVYLRKAGKLWWFSLDYRVNDPKATTYENTLDFMVASVVAP